MLPTRLLAVTLTAVLAVGCTSDREPTAAATEPVTAPEPTPEPTPEPPAPPPAVAGEIVDRTLADLSPSGTGVHPPGSDRDAPIPVDEAAVDGIVDAATSWLDAHLTDLQTGGPGLLARTWLADHEPELSTDLLDAAHLVERARYAVTVGVRGTPEWIRVTVAIDRESAATTRATFVFLPRKGDVRLIAAEVAS